MNILDFIIIALLALSAIEGFKKGFIASLTGLLALLLGVYAAMIFSEFMAAFISETFSFYSRHLWIISLVVTFVLVVVVVNLIGKMVEKLTDMLLLGFINHILGIFFGILKGIFILSVLIFFMNHFHISDRLVSKETRDKSKFYRSVESIVPGLYTHLQFLEEYNDKLLNKEIKGTV